MMDVLKLELLGHFANSLGTYHAGAVTATKVRGESQGHA